MKAGRVYFFVSLAPRTPSTTHTFDFSMAANLNATERDERKQSEKKIV